MATLKTPNSKKPYVIAAAAVLIQTLLGSLYAWSVFVPALREFGGLSAAGTQMIFGGMIAVFSITMVIAGRIVERTGPRPVAIASGLFYGGGYVAASFSGGSLLPMLFSISLFSGMGIGCGYVCALTSCLRWFPQRKGLVTGLAVAGFGAGAVGVSIVAGTLLSSGTPLMHIFRGIGFLFGGGIILCALFLDYPEASAASAVKKERRLTALWCSPVFWTASGGIFAGTFAGLMVIGNLKPIALAGGLEYSMAVAAISAFALGNTGGRLLWGWIYDKFGYLVLPASLALFGGVIFLLGPASSSQVVFLLMSILVGIGFGGCFVLYAAYIATHFGPANVGLVYPWVFLFHGAAALLGPAAGGWLFDISGSYMWSLALAGGVAWSAATALFLVHMMRFRRSETNLQTA